MFGLCIATCDSPLRCTQIAVVHAVQVAAFPDSEIRSISFSFWHKLSRQVTTNFSPRSTDSNNNPGQAAAEQHRRREFFQPAFEKLLHTVRAGMRSVTW